jgi:hypothetical protein
LRLCFQNPYFFGCSGEGGKSRVRSELVIGLARNGLVGSDGST